MRHHSERYRRFRGWGSDFLIARVRSMGTAVLAILNLTIAAGGAAMASSQTLVGAGALSDVAFSGTTCVATDEVGGIFSSSNSSSTWTKRFAAADKLTGLSCASGSLCAGVDSSGDLVKFDPV